MAKKKLTKSAKMGALWARLPKEVRVASYIGVSAGLWAFVKALGVEYEGDALAIAIINLIAVALETRVPQIRAKIK
jgi:hypothetical protein